MGEPNKAVELLLSHDGEGATELVRYINDLNTRRKKLEDKIWDGIQKQARDSHERVRLLDVRPTGRQMPKQALFVVEVDPGLSPSMAGRLQTVRTPAQGMERVGHPQDYTLMFSISSS